MDDVSRLHAKKLKRPDGIGLRENNNVLLSWDSRVADGSYTDAWQLRQDFFRLEEGDVQPFLQRVGVFSSAWPPEGLPAHFVIEVQTLLTEMLGQVSVKEAGSWLRTRLKANQKKHRQLQQMLAFSLKGTSTELTWDEDSTPVAKMMASTVLEAILATIQLDWAAGRRVRICSNERCKTEYQLVGERQKSFCSQRCQNSVAVRRGRARMAAE